MGKLKELKQSNKNYFIPSLIIIGVMVSKAYLAGLLEPLYKMLTGTPVYMENTSLVWWQIFIMVLLDFVIGAIYAWASSRKGTDESSLGTEEGSLGDKDEDELKSGERDAIINNMLSRGFSYLWMSGVSTIFVSVLWSGVLYLVTSISQTMIINNPSDFLVVYMVFTGMRLLVSNVIKTGVLAYATLAEYYPSNILQALMFTIRNIFKLALIEIVYYSWVFIGLMTAGIGVIVTHPNALGYRIEKWGVLVREYERDRLYGRI